MRASWWNNLLYAKSGSKPPSESSAAKFSLSNFMVTWSGVERHPASYPFFCQPSATSLVKRRRHLVRSASRLPLSGRTPSHPPPIETPSGCISRIDPRRGAGVQIQCGIGASRGVTSPGTRPIFISQPPRPHPPRERHCCYWNINIFALACTQGRRLSTLGTFCSVYICARCAERRRSKRAKRQLYVLPLQGFHPFASFASCIVRREVQFYGPRNIAAPFKN